MRYAWKDSRQEFEFTLRIRVIDLAALEAAAQRRVPPELVFELAFEGIRRSTRHKSGIALRFPRMIRWRKDKPVGEIDTIETLRALLDARDI